MESQHMVIIVHQSVGIGKILAAETNVLCHTLFVQANVRSLSPLEQLPNGSLELEPVVRKPSLTLAAPGPLDKQLAECWVSQEPVLSCQAAYGSLGEKRSSPARCCLELERSVDSPGSFLQ